MTINRAILTVKGTEYDILRFNYKFQRDIDAKGRPCSVYYGGEMSVQLESTDDTRLFKQLIDEDMPTVDGSIEVLSGDDEVCVRRIDFKGAYIYAYGENIQCTSSLPMTTAVSISPMRLDFNNLLKIDRRWPDYSGWENVKEEENYIKPTPQPPPTPLVKAVKGETSALPNDEVEYSVTNYNINVPQSDKDRVKWMVEVDGKQELQKQQGEKVKLTIKQEWTNKEITVMPYLKKPNSEVSVKTKVNVEAIVVFVNGYWNSGKSDMSIVELLKKMIAENAIGTQSKRGYWSSAFIKAANSYFQRKYNDWTSIKIEDKVITPIFIDGSNVWKSSGEVRFNAGWDEAEALVSTELIDKRVVNAFGKQMKRIFIVSHSMGSAHAEGMIAAWSWHGLEIERVLHFSAADNRDFQVKFPNRTYQINLLPDPVLIYKNSDDVIKTNFENFWKMMKRPYLDRPNGYMIERMLPDHYIEVDNDEQSYYNHYYTKSGTVWDLVPFLKL